VSGFPPPENRMAKRRRREGAASPEDRTVESGYEKAIGRREFVVAATGLLAANLGACVSEGVTGGPEGTVEVTITGLDPLATTGGSAVATPLSGGASVDITIPPVGHQSARVPAGDYDVTYATPASHVLAPGQQSARTITVAPDSVTAVNVALIATGTMAVNVTGLSGSAGGGTASAQRTDADASPVTINVSSAGGGSATVPTGTYAVTYTPPSGFSVAPHVPNPASGLVVALGATRTTSFTVEANPVTGSGTLQVAVTGLAGASNGGSASAQRTDAAGAPITIDVSVSGAGSASIPAGTYSVTYTPPSGFSVTGSNPLTGVVVAASGSATATFAVQVVSTAGVVFHSDFGTARGTSEAALLDTGKEVPWDIQVGNGRMNEVVAAAGLGFPAAMANVLRCGLEWNGNGAPTQLVRLENNRAHIPIPAVGGSIFYRWYIRVEQADAYTVDTNTHPIQDGFAVSDCNWFLRIESLGNGTFIGRWQVTNTNEFPNGFYSPPPLPKGEVFRYELQILRNTTSTFQIHTRVFDDEGRQVLSDSDFRNANGAVSLADNPSINIHVLANLAGLNAGHNGVFGPGQQELFPMLHSYQGGFAVRTDTWCGAYENGI
jgi:hypothetical protein